MSESKRFEGKVALVTGGGTGIGRAIAIRLAKEGAFVAIHNRTVSNAEETLHQVEAVGGKGKIYQVDVSDRTQIKNAVAATIADLKHIDILVNNAGVNNYKEFLEFEDEEWDQIINVNLNALWSYCRQVCAHMVENHIEGAVVNISSIGAEMSSYMRVPYMSSKGGSHMFTQALAQDMGKYNIRVNAVAPGCIETEMTRPDQKRPGYSSRPMIKMLTALHRYGKPEDIAAAVSYLASDDAAYVTGATLTVDGGMNAGNPNGLPVLPVPDKALGVDVPWLDEFDYVQEYKEKCM